MSKCKAPKPKIEPPARIEYGPGGRPDSRPYGIEHLRSVLQLPPDVSQQHVCEEAALRFEQMPVIPPLADPDDRPTNPWSDGQGPTL